MTIFVDFDPTAYSIGTALDSLGFTDYQSLNTGSVPTGVDPNWVIAAAPRNASYSVAGQNQLGPRTLIGTGSPLIRVEAVLRGPNLGPPVVQDGFVCLAKDEFNFIRCRRFGFYGDSAQGISFDTVKAGIQVLSGISGPDWPLGSINGTPAQNYAGDPLNLTFRYDNVAHKFYVDVEGVQMAAVDIPAWLQDPMKVGYYDYFATFSYPPFKIRDDNDRIAILKPDTTRTNTTQSNLIIPGFSNITGATGISFTIRDAANAIVAGPVTGTLSGGITSASLGPIPKNKEAVPLKISATNVGGTPQTTTIAYQMLETQTLQTPTQIGINTNYELYYTYCPFNDLVKMGQWQLQSDVNSYFFSAMPWNDPADWHYDAGTAPASYLDMQENGCPLRLPVTGPGFLRFIFPMYPEAGTYVLDMSQCPDADWIMAGTKFTASLCTLEMNIYGPGKHRVVITEAFIPLYTDATAESYLYIDFRRNGARANNGIPTTPWTFSCTRLGASPDMVWSPGYLAWAGGLAVKHKRYMDGQLANEPAAAMTERVMPARAVPRMSDTLWQTRFLSSSHPPEALAQLHNYLGWDIWLNFSRLDSDAAILEKLSRLRAALSPSLKIYVTVSNENWNSAPGFANAYVSYLKMGLRRGLGLIMPVTGWVASNSDELNITVAGIQPLTVGMRVRPHGQTDTAPFVYITSQLTGTAGGVGKYKLNRVLQYGFATSGSPQQIICDLAQPATDMGSYTGDYLNWVSGGTYAVGNRLNYNGIIYECIQAAVGRTTFPTTDTAYWRPWQNTTHAKDRAYTEDMFRIRGIAANVYGSQAAADAQVKYICESFSLEPFNWNEYLAWGDGTLRGADIYFGLAVDTYFGGKDLQWATLSTDDRNTILTTTGSTRRAFFRNKAKNGPHGTETIWRLFRSNKTELVKRLRSLGVPDGQVQLCSYEGGQAFSIQISAAVTAGANAAALSQDLFDFYTQDFEDIYTDFYNNLSNQVGGLLSHYHQLWPSYKGWSFTSVFSEYNMFMISNNYKDTETSSRYRGLRAAALAHGGVIVAPPALLTQRRRGQPLIYRRVIKEPA